jgi:hypothetical protein
MARLSRITRILYHFLKWNAVQLIGRRICWTSSLSQDSVIIGDITNIFLKIQGEEQVGFDRKRSHLISFRQESSNDVIC